jgi:hypothetical protein
MQKELGTSSLCNKPKSQAVILQPFLEEETLLLEGE